MKIHVCRLDCQIDHVAEAAAGDSALQHVAIGYLARAEKAEAEVAVLRKVEIAARARWVKWTRETYDALGVAFHELDEHDKLRTTAAPTKEKP